MYLLSFLMVSMLQDNKTVFSKKHYEVILRLSKSRLYRLPSCDIKNEISQVVMMY